MRCLIVDDSADFVEAARRLLGHGGITVVGVATTSAEALRYFEEQRPDVTLVDVDLGSENGFELAEQLHRSELPTPPPVILISTHAEQDLADMIAASPAIGFLAKFALTPGAIRDLVGAAAGLPQGECPSVFMPCDSRIRDQLFRRR
jgi:CheY-like chemotaxis protein